MLVLGNLNIDSIVVRYVEQRLLLMFIIIITRKEESWKVDVTLHVERVPKERSPENEINLEILEMLIVLEKTVSPPFSNSLLSSSSLSGQPSLSPSLANIYIYHSLSL